MGNKTKNNVGKKTLSLNEFVQNFVNAGRKFLKHFFIAKQQASFYKNIKENLQNDEALIICDFAENYAFVIQNSITGFHWNNDQATIFPIVFYLKKKNDQNASEPQKIEHETLVIISDCKKHDAVAVYVFLKAFNEYLSTKYPHIRKCIYFSDGAPQQFKNIKHFATIYNHVNDFNHSAVWHFHASAHGKGPCDGAGGTLKRLARRASLQMIGNDRITSPSELYEWATKESSLPNISVLYRDSHDYEKANKILEQRFEKCKTISGTHEIHFIEPVENDKLRVKAYSFCESSRIVSFVKPETKRASRSKK